MNDTKPKWLLQSKTIWGGILMMLPTIASILGIELSSDQVGAVAALADELFEFIGFSLVAYGRITASAPVTITGKGGNQSGYVERSLMYFMSLFGVLLLLVACGSNAFFSKPQSCSYYQDPVYVKFCESDLLIEAAKAAIQDYQTLSNPPPDLDAWQEKVSMAEAELVKAHALYRDSKLIITGDQKALDAVLRSIEVWLYGA